MFLLTTLLATTAPSAIPPNRRRVRFMAPSLGLRFRDGGPETEQRSAGGDLLVLTLVRTVQLRVRVQAHAEPRLVEHRSFHAPIHRHRLIQKKRRKRRQNLVG